jgi:hypothetical protein
MPDQYGFNHLGDAVRCIDCPRKKRARNSTHQSRQREPRRAALAPRSGRRHVITQELHLQREAATHSICSWRSTLEARPRRFRLLRPGTVRVCLSAPRACYRVGEPVLGCWRALAPLSISAHPSQIEWENMFRWSIAARMSGEGRSQVSSIRTRPHQAQAGSIRPASNSVQMRENVSLISIGSSLRPASPARGRDSCRRSSRSAVVSVGGGGGFRRWRRRRR